MMLLLLLRALHSNRIFSPKQASFPPPFFFCPTMLAAFWKAPSKFIYLPYTRYCRLKADSESEPMIKLFFLFFLIKHFFFSKNKEKKSFEFFE